MTSCTPAHGESPRAPLPRPSTVALLAVIALVAAIFTAGPAAAAGGVSATATVGGRAIAGANASNPVRLDPKKVVLVVVEVTNGTAKPVSVRRVDLAGHVLGLNFYSYSTTVELTVAAGKSDKLTYRLDPAGLDGQATGLIGSDLTLIGADGKPLTAVHTVVDVRGSLMSVYGLFGIIIAVLTGLAIADAALTVARHRLSANRWQRGLRLLAPGLGIGLMIGFTASVARWWVPGTELWLTLAGVVAWLFFLAGYLSPTPGRSDDLGLDPEDLAAARERDARGFAASVPGAPVGAGMSQPGGPHPGIGGPDPALFPVPGPNPPYGGTYPDLPAPGQPGGTFRDLDIRGANPADAATRVVPGAPVGPPAARVFPGGPAPDAAGRDFYSGETTRMTRPGFGGAYPGGGPLASAMTPPSGETAVVPKGSDPAGTIAPSAPGTIAPSGPATIAPSGPVTIAPPGPGTVGSPGPGAVAASGTGSGGLPAVSRPPDGPGSEPFRCSASGVEESTMGYPSGVQRPRPPGGRGETTFGRGVDLGKPGEEGDEPTIRSAPGGKGSGDGGTGT